MNDFLSLLSMLPGGNAVIAWADQLAAMTLGQQMVELARLFFQFIGLWEFFKYIYRWVFKRRSRLEAELEVLEARVHERNTAISKVRAERDQLTAELLSARNALPGAAVARAEHELRDFNHALAITRLETWFAENSGGIATIAKHLARHHIAAAVPEPADHLARAADMLRVARGVSPADQESREISAEFDTIRAGLQEQLLRDGDALLRLIDGKPDDHALIV